MKYPEMKEKIDNAIKFLETEKDIHNELKKAMPDGDIKNMYTERISDIENIIRLIEFAYEV